MGGGQGRKGVQERREGVKVIISIKHWQRQKGCGYREQVGKSVESSLGDIEESSTSSRRGKTHHTGPALYMKYSQHCIAAGTAMHVTAMHSQSHQTKLADFGCSHCDRLLP